MGDLMATGNNPGTTYTPSETNGVYHEDREVTLVSGGPGSQMYRVYNAAFNTALQKWGIQDSSLPAYATVQNPDGSIHYYVLNTTTGLWEGSGNNAIFNGVDFGMLTGSGIDNTSALTDALNAAFNAGGHVFIPPGTYHFSGTVSINNLTPGSDHGMIIAGVGSDTELVQDTGADLFLFAGFGSGRGVRLRDLRLTYAGPGLGSPTAVRLESCQNITCERVWFRDFPSTFIDDDNTEQCGLSDCNIDYSTTYGAQTMVTFTGTQEFIDNCVFANSGGATGCTGLLLTSVDTAYITNTHISDFDYGIQIQGGGPNLHHAFFSNISCQSVVTSLQIKPLSSGNKIYQLFFVNCIFARSGSSTNTTPGILIHTNGGTSDKVSDICFTNCMSHDWAGPGMEINGGQDIVVTGGRYGQNATDSSMTTSGAIAVTGPAVRVSIVGSDCSGVIPSYNSQPPATDPQPYGISVTGAVVAMKVRDCDLTNNHNTIGLYAPTAGTDLQVTDCAGYNDQGTVVSTTAPPSTTQFNGSYSGFSAPYFGPVTFYVKPGTGTITHIKLNGHDTNQTSGTFSISPGAWKAEIDYTAAVDFLMIGY